MKDLLKNKWFKWGLVALVIYLAYRYWKNTQAPKNPSVNGSGGNGANGTTIEPVLSVEPEATDNTDRTVSRTSAPLVYETGAERLVSGATNLVSGLFGANVDCKGTCRHPNGGVGTLSSYTKADGTLGCRCQKSGTTILG